MPALGGEPVVVELLLDGQRQVVSVSGDGGLSMLLGELITAATLRIPVKVVLFNNSTLGMVKLEMLVEGLPDFGVDVPDTNYAAIAEAMITMMMAIMTLGRNAMMPASRSLTGFGPKTPKANCRTNRTRK